MREIKFRGIRVDNKEWIYGYYLKQDGVIAIMDDNKFLMAIIENTLSQFTDIKDKNGKEIYEGDIVSFPWCSPMGEPEEKHSYYGKVVFEDGAYFMKPIKSDSGYWHNQFLYRLLFVNTKVIGNIYENPELLKQYD